MVEDRFGFVKLVPDRLKVYGVEYAGKAGKLLFNLRHQVLYLGRRQFVKVPEKLRPLFAGLQGLGGQLAKGLRLRFVQAFKNRSIPAFGCKDFRLAAFLRVFRYD